MKITKMKIIDFVNDNFKDTIYCLRVNKALTRFTFEEEQVVKPDTEIPAWALPLFKAQNEMQILIGKLARAQNEIPKWAIPLFKAKDEIPKWAIPLLEAHNKIPEWAIPLLEAHNKIPEWAIPLFEAIEEIRQDIKDIKNCPTVKRELELNKLNNHVI